MIEVQKSKGRGRGVFATENIPRGLVFHKSPAIVLKRETSLGELETYLFAWTPGHVAVALGLGSLFNHSSSPDADFETIENDLFPEIHFTSKRKIKAGQEIFICYGHLYEWDERPRG